MNLLLSPGKAGLVGGILSILFFLIVVVLGFTQPGYNHFQNTISYLVVGEMGWIQTVNFMLLALALVLVGYGFGVSLLKMQVNIITAVFWMLAFSLLMIALIPTEKTGELETISLDSFSLVGRLHYLTVFVLLFLIPIPVIKVISFMQKSSDWKNLASYTRIVLIFNFLVGLLWFFLINGGYLQEWKGLIQKILVTNVLIWLTVIGYRVWKLESIQHLEGN